MSFDQAKISHDSEVFVPSWLASISGSQKLAKTLKPQDIEAVNVVKTCDKLHMALMKTPYLNQRVGDTEQQCAVREDHTPFRTFTNLWYGTLKIYEQQVNTLLRQSHDLVVRSSTYDVKSLESSKRKSGSTTHQLIKKRRLTISEGNGNTFLSSNYTELLDDLEKLTQDTLENNIEEPIQFLTSSKSRCTRPRAQLEIREITIREISATTYGMPDIEDDDTGFGEATHEEISDFFNFFQENSKTENKKTPTKRMTVYESEPSTKYCRYSHDSTLEPIRNENITMAKGFLRTPSFRYSSLDRPSSPASTIETKMYAPNETFKENKENPISSSILLQQNCVENSKQIDDPFYINNFQSTDIKDEIGDDGYKSDSNNEISMAKKKTSKLIIDECIKLEPYNEIQQVRCLPELTKVAKKLIFKKLKTKKSPTALELLTRFNRRALKMTLSLKQKISAKPEQFKRDYLNLICAILKTDCSEEWASIIYPKWQQTNTSQKQRNSKSLNKNLNAKQGAILNILDEHLNLAPIDGNNNKRMENQNDQIPPKNFEEFKESQNYIASVEWRPYSVMMKLLDSWRYSTTNEINAIDFCNSAKNPIDKALTFYSLLNLSKNQYINITKLPPTIKMDKIVMGKIIKNIINSN